MAEPDFGTDLSCKDDLDPTMREVSGLPLLQEASYRRLKTPRGALLDDEDYGLGIDELLSQAKTLAQVAAIPGRISGELAKDERIRSASVTTNPAPIAIVVETAGGPFSLTLGVADAAKQLGGA